MMWYSKDRKRGVNPDLVCYFEYNSYFAEPPQITLWFGKLKRVFEGKEADEIYEMLVQNKQLLKS